MEKDVTDVDASATLWGYLLMVVGVLLFMSGMVGGAAAGMIPQLPDFSWMPWLGAALVVLGLVIVFGEDTGEAQHGGKSSTNEAGEDTAASGAGGKDGQAAGEMPAASDPAEEDDGGAAGRGGE